MSLSLKNFYICQYLAKLQARAWLSHALCAPGQHTEESARDESITYTGWPRIVVHISTHHIFETVQDKIKRIPPKCS